MTYRNKREQADGTWLCTRCEVCKPRDAFSVNRRQGLQSWCKECKNANFREHYARRTLDVPTPGRRSPLVSKLQPDGTLLCSGCGLCKSSEAFVKASKGKYGVQSRCKECDNTRRRALGMKPRLAPLDHPEGQKICRQCLVAKDLEEFFSSAKSISGRMPYCRKCHYKRWGPGAIRQRDGMPYEDVKRDERYRRKYGISLDQVREMEARQNHLCVICLAGPAEHVDHHHISGKVRELLCHPCNVGLGSFKDDIVRMIRAAVYLARHNEDWGNLRVGASLIDGELGRVWVQPS